MKVFELSKEFGVTNKELIDFLKSKGFKVSSHSQNLTDEMIEISREGFPIPDKKEEEKKTEEAPKKTVRKTLPPVREVKKYNPDDLIPCRSIVPWYLETLGLDKRTPYKWPGYGDLEYVAYRDLQSWRRKPIIMEGMIFIEDPDICEQWKNDLGKVYKNYVGIEYPEEFFDKSDEEFEKMLTEATDSFKEIIKYTAAMMIRNENYPSIQKISIVDRVLGTGLKDLI